MDTNTSRIIGTAALISVGVGTLNSFYKSKKPPSARFLIGSGAAFVILSAIGEGEPEVAKALAIAVATTTVLGDGGGVLSYINNGEIDTKKSNPLSAEDGTALVSSADIYGGETGPFTPETPDDLEEFQEHGAELYPSSVVVIRPKPFLNDTIGLIPGML